MNFLKKVWEILKYAPIALVLGAFVYVGYVWTIYYLNWDYSRGFAIKNVYTNVGGRYQIGGSNGDYTEICDSQIKRGCFLGYLKGVRIINSNEAYIYFQLSTINYYYADGFDSNGEPSRSYLYGFFGLDDHNIPVKSKEDFPQYGYIQGDSIKLYSPKELSNLDKAKVDIFKDLEKNPTIIINGTSYKHYDIIPENEDWNKK